MADHLPEYVNVDHFPDCMVLGISDTDMVMPGQGPNSIPTSLLFMIC